MDEAYEQFKKMVADDGLREDFNRGFRRGKLEGFIIGMAVGYGLYAAARDGWKAWKKHRSGK